MKQVKKHKITWYLSWFISLVIIFSLATGLILSLPLWRLSKAEIFGADLMVKNKVINIAKIPFGENIFFVDVKAINKKFKNVIQIKSVKIYKRLPDTLRIKIEERIPFALVIIGNKTMVVDDEGYIIATQGGPSYFVVHDVSRFPVVSGLKVKDLIEGSRLDLKDRDFILKTLKLLSVYFSPESLQLKIGDHNNIVVFVEDVLRLELGDTGRIEKKIAAFGAILKKIEGKWEKIEYINVKIPDNPAVKYKL